MKRVSDRHTPEVWSEMLIQQLPLSTSSTTTDESMAAPTVVIAPTGPWAQAQEYAVIEIVRKSHRASKRMMHSHSSRRNRRVEHLRQSRPTQSWKYTY